MAPHVFDRIVGGRSILVPQSHFSLFAGWTLVPRAQAQPAKRDKRSFKLSSTAIYWSQAFAAVVLNLQVEFLLKYKAVNQLITE